MPSLNWRTELESMPRVQKLVHLAARLDAQDVEALAKLNFQQKRKAYTNALNVLIAQVGCSKRAVISGVTQSLIKTQADEEADGIVNTYNYHLAKQIQTISYNTPTANRHVYAKQLRDWHNGYMKWKSAQIALHNELEWGAKAQSDFSTFNDVEGYAELEPSTYAVCDVCKHWIARGRVKLSEALRAMETWPPHVNCIHSWKIVPGKIADCNELWVGVEPGGKKAAEKGGEGSGNFDHTGRPGKVGGSGLGVGSGTTTWTDSLGNELIVVKGGSSIPISVMDDIIEYSGDLQDFIREPSSIAARMHDMGNKVEYNPDSNNWHINKIADPYFNVHPMVEMLQHDKTTYDPTLVGIAQAKGIWMPSMYKGGLMKLEDYTKYLSDFVLANANRLTHTLNYYLNIHKRAIDAAVSHIFKFKGNLIPVEVVDMGSTTLRGLTI